MFKILLVDDDIELTELLSEVLKLEGFLVEVAGNGQEALAKLDATYDLVLLDIMMPVLNGLDTLKLIRQTSHIPVMMLTARDDENDRILGLELGADDYLSKPFNDRELIGRIRAILRRVGIRQLSETKDNQTKISELVEFNKLIINIDKQTSYYERQPIDLTQSELALLHYLIMHQGQVISREELCLNVLGKKLAPFDRSIDMHMSNLRRKLPKRIDGLPWIRTLRNRGYILVPK